MHSKKITSLILYWLVLNWIYLLKLGENPVFCLNTLYIGFFPHIVFYWRIDQIPVDNAWIYGFIVALWELLTKHELCSEKAASAGGQLDRLSGDDAD